MNIRAAQKSTVVVTPAAVSLLAQLGVRYRKNLRFRVFAAGLDCPTLRVHDKDYSGDVLLDCAGTGVALCANTFYAAQALQVDCRAASHCASGFELLLHVNKRLTAILPGDSVIGRIAAEERPGRGEGAQYGRPRYA